ncbi:mechanosensitive ion channel family protein [Mesorhizobium sp. ORM16]|uniref:mechanosensitive ion channel family protein n=1 Tax=Mesorhizobium sp. ORM16 TaxID=3376989 RepID=UPI0038572037
MSDNPSPGADLTSLTTTLEEVAGRFVEGAQARYLAWFGAPAEYDSLRSSLAAASTSVTGLCFQIALVSGIVAGTFLLISRQANRNGAERSSWRRFSYRSAAAVAALVIGLLVAQLLAGPGLPLRTLRLWTALTVVACIMIFAVQAVVLAKVRAEFRDRPIHLTALVRDLTFALMWALGGLSVVSTLRMWSAGPGITDLIGTSLVTIPTLILLIRAVWRHRRTMAGSVGGNRPRGRWRAGFARIWPAIVIGILLFIAANAQIARTLGAALPGLAVLLSALMVVAIPHLDSIVWAWAERGLESRSTSTAAVAWRQTARLALVIVMVALLGTIWATPLAVGLSIDLRSVTRQAFGVALIALLAAFLWNLISTAIERISLVDSVPNPLLPRSRLGTLIPLLGAIGKSSVLVMAALSILVSIGVNVWPLITGLSVFGLAIGFGSQTLVKDIVSGLFFLIDDAFRAGEYIETTGAKGTVEKISVRSVRLRGARGSLATIPYGQMGKIENFSRDWAIDKMTFRVALDTDVDLVRQLLEKIGSDLMADPGFAPFFIEPFKSQGVVAIEDGTLLIGSKFKAKPGKQSEIQRAAVKGVHNAFRENGVRMVPKPLMDKAAGA